jgi:hypothetical protein
MKYKYKSKVGKYVIITGIVDATNGDVDIEKTKRKIAPMITPGMTDAEIEKLYMDNVEYSNRAPDADLIDDIPGNELLMKLNKKGKNQVLLDSGEYILNYLGTEYWMKTSNRWVKEKVVELGVPLPEGAVLADNLTEAQKKEIADQNEADRIAGLTAAEKESEKKAILDSLADEADRLSRRYQIQGVEFDTVAWYHEHKVPVEEKYAS